MASATSFPGISLRPSVPFRSHISHTRFAQFQVSFGFPANPTSLKSLNSVPSKKREAFSNGSSRTRRDLSQFSVRCTVSSSGKITQQEFTEMAWQAIVSAPEVAKENKHQIVETEHLMKALLEQKNGLARRIFSKVGVDNTRLLEATDKHIKRQPKVIDQVKFAYALLLVVMS
ncbi:hypothetical protein ACSQ67_008351 [Phaseolus vulgaris]